MHVPKTAGLTEIMHFAVINKFIIIVTHQTKKVHRTKVLASYLSGTSLYLSFHVSRDNGF